MANVVYDGMSDDMAIVSIRSCLRGAIRPGVAMKDIHAALQRELGISGVDVNINPKPIDGIIPQYQGNMMQFQFMAHGPSGKTITG